MFAQKLKILTQAFSFSKNVFKSAKFFKNSRKIALVGTSLFLMPACISMAQNNDANQIQQKIQTNQDSQQKIQKEDETIVYISDYDEPSKLDLTGKVLIWYQCSGIQKIDEQVIKMLNKFVKQRKGSISCPFKIVIDTSPRSKPVTPNDYYKQDVQLVIVKPEDLRPINLGKHLSFNGVNDLKYSTLFERLNKQVNGFNEVNSQNVTQFIESLGDRNSQSYIFMAAPKDQLNINKARKRFSNFVDSKQTFNVHAFKGFITDDQALKTIGLEYKADQDNIYVMVPYTDNVLKPGKIIQVKNKKYCIYSPEQVSSSVIFPPYLQKSSPQSYLLKVVVDLNQNVAAKLSELYNTLSQQEKCPQLASLPKMLVFNSIKDKDANPIKILLQKNNFNQIVNIYSQNCRLSDQQKKQVLKGQNTWRYQSQSEQISPEQLQKWANDVIANKVPATFESEKKQNTKVKKYNSLKITGEEYPQILNKNKEKPKIIFHYSEHCHSCNKFKHLYQEVAGQQKQKYQFYRINNDFNRSQGLRNYNSTPVFVFYKNGSPYYYKNTIFTKAVFENFVQITGECQQVDKKLFEKNIKDRLQNKFQISEL